MLLVSHWFDTVTLPFQYQICDAAAVCCYCKGTVDPCSEIYLARKKKSNMMKTQIGLYTRMCNGEESYSDVTEYIIYIVKDL